MTTGVRVGIIGGTGWLGRSIAAHALSAGVIDPGSLTISSRSGRGDVLAEWPGVAHVSENAELVRRSTVVVLSVRPQQFAEVASDMSGRLVISVMAGVSLASLEQRLGTDRVIRAMPNAAAEIARSYTPWFSGPGVTDADRAFVGALMACCGDQDEVSREDFVDYLAGLSGSGPAFPALLASAMLAHASERGLPADVAGRAVKAVICGSGRLLESGEFDPLALLQTFMDYRGTTAAALAKMIETGFNDAVKHGLSAAETAGAAMARRSSK